MGTSCRRTVPFSSSISSSCTDASHTIIPCTGASCVDPSFTISYAISSSTGSSGLTTGGGMEPEVTSTRSPVLLTDIFIKIRCGGDAVCITD
jgi:hypothetical protein